MTSDFLSSRCHGGVQGVLKHVSAAAGVARPSGAIVKYHHVGERLPMPCHMSGLFCTFASVMGKGEYRPVSQVAEVIIVVRDNSPPDGDGPDAPRRCDFPPRAAFIPKRQNCYIWQSVPANMPHQGITRHSIGGQNALAILRRNSVPFRSSPPPYPSLDQARTRRVRDVCKIVAISIISSRPSWPSMSRRYAERLRP